MHGRVDGKKGMVNDALVETGEQLNSLLALLFSNERPVFGCPTVTLKVTFDPIRIYMCLPDRLVPH